jgi:hypothetical protein
MKDMWRGEELVRELCHPRPDQPSPLAAPTQLPVPEHGDVVAECADCRTVGRHGVVGKIPSNDLAKPFPGFRNWPVPPLLQRLLDLPQLRSSAIASRLSFDLKVAPSRFAANQYEAQEFEGFRLG